MRPHAGLVGQIESGQHFLHASRILRQTGEELRELHILGHGQAGQQMQALQHDADVAAAKFVERCSRQCGEILSGNTGAAGRRPQDTGKNMQQRGFAAA